MGYAPEDYDYADVMSHYETRPAEYFIKKIEHAADWFCYLDTHLRSPGPLSTELIERALEEIAFALECNLSDSELNIKAVR